MTLKTVPNTLVVLGLIGFLSACGPKYAVPPDFAMTEDTAAEESSPLGGDALAQRKLSLSRAHKDLEHFQKTLASLRYRKDRSGTILFVNFLEAYMGTHLTPILSNEWQSRHPELMGLDANLRFAQAELLGQMRDPRRVQGMIEDIERRFSGRGNMLIEYPYGEHHTLSEGLTVLRERKWRG